MSTFPFSEVQAAGSHPQDLDTPCGPKTPKVLQKPSSTACEGMPWLRLDEQGMVLTHSILGRLDDFRSYLEAKGETELLTEILKSQRNAPYEVPLSRYREASVKERGLQSIPTGIQNNALQNWQTHMKQRRQQQDRLSDLLHRPVETLLMNQDKHFRESQEQKDILKRVMPLIQSGYGFQVGSEFWTLPPRYGGEVSGITGTLTQTELGNWKPIIRIGKPGTVQKESGILSEETSRPASRPWLQCSYLQKQFKELGNVLQDQDLNKPDFRGLEVIGSCKPPRSEMICSSQLEAEEMGEDEEQELEEQQEEEEEDVDSLAKTDESQSRVLRGPLLKFCGQYAGWTGPSATDEEEVGNDGNLEVEVGISANLVFDALTGEKDTAILELRNEGTTVIFYSWQQLPWSNVVSLFSRPKRKRFYFNSSSGVILPGETKLLEFIFKSDNPGIETEVWQLNTHPVLLQGASIQVTLRGMSLFQDKTEDQRRYIETKLEKRVVEKMCRSFVYDILRGVHSTERPSSPAALYITEEEKFLDKNPKLQYYHQPVEDLKRLWEKVSPGQSWDLSIEALRQAVMLLPDGESDENSKEANLVELNSLLLQLSEPLDLSQQHLSPASIGEQLWRRLLDTMAGEAIWLRSHLGLPDLQTWIERPEESRNSDGDLHDETSKDEKCDKKGAGKIQRKSPRSRCKDTRSPTDKAGEECKKKGKKKDEGAKRHKEKHSKESISVPEIPQETCPQEPVEEQYVDPKLMDIYKKLLHKKVYALLADLAEELVDTLNDLRSEGFEEAHVLY